MVQYLKKITFNINKQRVCIWFKIHSELLWAKSNISRKKYCLILACLKVDNQTKVEVQDAYQGSTSVKGRVGREKQSSGQPSGGAMELVFVIRYSSFGVFRPLPGSLYLCLPLPKEVGCSGKYMALVKSLLCSPDPEGTNSWVLTLISSTHLVGRMKRDLGRTFPCLGHICNNWSI